MNSTNQPEKPTSNNPSTNHKNRSQMSRTSATARAKQKKERRMNRRNTEDRIVNKIVTIVVVVLVLIISILGFTIFRYVQSSLNPLDPHSNKKIEITIPTGSSNKQIGEILEKGHIIKMNVNYLKIDASLIKNIATNENSYKITKTIIEFAKNLNLKTIAEFVENEEIFNIVRNLGADYSQGYFFSAPISAPNVVEYNENGDKNHE